MEKRQQGLKQKKLDSKQRAKERRERRARGEDSNEDEVKSHAVPIVAGDMPEEISSGTSVKSGAVA